ncbi:MAG: phosphatidate cytidylyltransferase [Acidimicrobiales bacterium]
MTRTDRPEARPETTGPPTDRVRIFGAEPAGEITRAVPTVSLDAEPATEAHWPPPPPAPGQDGPAVDDGPVGMDGDELGQPKVRLTGEPAAADSGVTVVHPVNPGQTAVPSSGAAATELPHWTEPPTGQVPAVLARDSGDEGSGIGAPSWREEDADWVAHDEEFEPAMFGDDNVALGSLDETDSTDVDRRPWEFDLDSVRPGAASPSRPSDGFDREGDDAPTIAPITEPTEVVAPLTGDAGPGLTGDAGPGLTGDAGPGRGDGEGSTGGTLPTDTPLPGSVDDAHRTGASAGAVAAAGAAAGAAGEMGPGTTASGSAGAGTGGVEGDPVVPVGHAADEELSATDKPRPTGGTRAGRARRTGLLPARMRAKRPEDVDVATGSPLAAEPPGASVTDVPGVGLKRGGVAGLAAADRSAQRDGEPQVVAVSDAATDWTRPAPDGVDLAATAAVAAGVPRRRPKRWSASDPSPDSGAAKAADGPTGGGPPPARRPGRPPRNTDGSRKATRSTSMAVRVGTGIAVAVIALGAFKLGTVTALALCLVVVTFAAGECFGVLRRAGYHPATLLGLVGTISLMIGAYDKGIAAVPLILVLITAFTLIWYLFGIERGSPVAGTAATLLTVGWVSLLGAYAGLLLSPSMFPDRHGIAFLLGAIIATVANDVGALVIGGGMGRHPLAPTISPNKTWEGLVGGALFSILASTVIVGNIHPWTPSNAAVLGVVVAIVAPIGDLCESLLKRDLKLKDMGSMLPGHGGVLDRVDALLFVLPATYYLVRALNIG